MDTKFRYLLDMLLKEEKIFQENSQLLLSGRCVENVDKQKIVEDTKRRLERLTGMAQNIECFRQEMVANISEGCGEFVASDKLRELFNDVAVPAIRDIEDLAGTISNIQHIADDCCVQSEILIDNSNTILLESENPFRQNLMVNQQIPQREPAC
jgi:hypothetical protein